MYMQTIGSFDDKHVILCPGTDCGSNCKNGVAKQGMAESSSAVGQCHVTKQHFQRIEGGLFDGFGIHMRSGEGVVMSCLVCTSP